MFLLLLRTILFIEHRKLIVICMYNWTRFCYFNDKSKKISMSDRNIVVCSRLLLLFYLLICWISWTLNLISSNFIFYFLIVISILFRFTQQHRDIDYIDFFKFNLSKTTLFIIINNALSSKSICDFCFWFDIVERKTLNVLHMSRYDLLKIENHLKRNFVFQDCRWDFEEEIWIEFWNNIRIDARKRLNKRIVVFIL